MCSALDFQSGCQAKPDCRWGRIIFLFVCLIDRFGFLGFLRGGGLAIFFLFFFFPLSFSPFPFHPFSITVLVAAQLQKLYILPAGLQAVNYLPGLKEKVAAWDPGAQGSCVAESSQLNISASFRFPVCLLSTGIGSIVELQTSLLFPLKSPYIFS